MQGGLTVTPGYTNGTAANGDYTANTTALTFAGTKGETETFTVSTIEDAVLEANETFTVDLTVSNAPNGVTATDTGTGTINNDDSTAVTVNDKSASEGDDMTFTVTLSEAVQGGVTVTPDFTDVTADEGTDYDENTTALTFTGTKVETKTFTVSTDEDAILEADETFTVGLTVSGAPTGTTVTASDTGTGTINDDDSAAVTVNDADADEGDDMTFTVTLSEAVQGGLKVTPSYTNGTAASGDYTKNTTALTFTGTKGETKTFTVSTAEDAVLEANETFTVGLSVSDAPTGTTVTATDTGTGTIDNDDGATVTVNDANADEGDGMTFTVTLGEAVQGGLKVTPGYTNGTAASGDYTKNTTALTFTGTKGETKTFTVSTTEDAVLEADETFTVGLSVSGTSLSVTATDTGTGTIDNDDSAAVTVNDANADEGNGMTFTVTLDKAVQGGLKVTPSYTNGTAASSDYTANTAALTFTGNANETKTFTVQTKEDEVVEGNETFTVGLSVSGTSLGVTATDTGAGTINNDDGAVVTVNNANADEGDAITFTVTLGDAVQGGLTVTPSFTDVTAVEGTDYDENTAALSFSGTEGETKTFTVSTTEDAVFEADETFTVGLSVSNSSVTATDTGTGTINNDDSAAVTVNDASADEGDGMTFTVTLDTAVQGGLKVTPGYTNGTAASGDYTANTTALTFTGTANETKTFTVSTTEDAILEADETFTVGLSVSNAPPGVTSTDTATGTIDNDDGSGVIIADAGANEGQSMTFTVTLTEAVQGGLTVTPGPYTNGTAESGDYIENTTALNFTGTANETQTFMVQTTEDLVLEEAETFTVGLTVTGTSLDIIDDDTGTGTIYDDDDAPSVNLSVSPTSVGENDGATPVTVTAKFSNATTYAAGTTVTVSVGASGDSAASGTDYDAVIGFTITIAAGQTQGSASFILTPTDDTLVEGSETITVSGTNADLTVNGTSLTLTDDDGGAVDNLFINLSVDPAGVAEDARATAVTVTAEFSAAVTYPTDTTVRVSAGDSADSAVSGTDYDAVSDFTITIPAGRTSGSAPFTLTPTDDTLVEGNETITVSGTNADLTVKGTSLTLTDDERAAANLVIDLSVDPASVAEDAGATAVVTVTAEFSNAVTYATDTTVTVGVGAGGDSAVSGTDYAAVSGFTVTIPAGRTSGSAPFTLTPTDDTLVEGDETITVSGTNAALTVNGASLTLTDDEEPVSVPESLSAIVLSANPSTVSEDAGATTVTVTAAVSDGGAFADDRTVTVSVGASGDSAASGTDYGAVSYFTITIPAGQTSGSAPFTLTPVDDTLDEGNETISVDGTATGLTVKGTNVTLTDSEALPAIALSANPSNVSEDAGRATVTVTATVSDGGAFADDRTVTVSVGDDADGAAPGTDYTAVSDFKIAIPAGSGSGSATFVLIPANDNLVEGDERIAVSGASPGLTVTGTGVTLADAAAVAREPRAASVADASAQEGQVLRFTVTLDRAPGPDGPVTVGYATRDGSARAGQDYTAVSGRLTFAAGETEKTVGVPTLDDALDEGDETLFLHLSGGANATLARSSARGTIGNEDPLPSAWLARCGRVASDHVADAVEARLGEREAGPRLVVGGQDVSLGASETRFEGDPPSGSAAPEPRTMTGSEALANSAFRLASGDERTPDGQTRWTAWGSGAAKRFEGGEAGLSLDGETVGATVGLDAERGRWTAGVAVARNACRGTWRDGESGLSGSVETPLTSVHPYARWTAGELSLWVMAGLGQGEFTVTTESGEVSQENDVGMTMAALGGRRTLASAKDGAGVDLAARWNALVIRMKADAAENMRPVDARTSRARLALEAGRTFDLPDGGGSVSPSLELGVRHDGGDAERGTGLEVGGAVRYAEPVSGLTVELRGRGLLTHGADGYREWGAGGTVRLGPGADGLGLSFRLQPSWGPPESDVAALWEDGASTAALARQAGGGHLDAEFGYGVRAWEGRAVLTPMAGFTGSSAGERTWRAGARFLSRGGLEASLIGERTTGGGEVGHGVMLRARYRW